MSQNARRSYSITVLVMLPGDAVVVVVDVELAVRGQPLLVDQPAAPDDKNILLNII